MKALSRREGPGRTGVGAPSGQGVTIYDVARRAGVGIATVSRAMHGSAPVAPATRTRILAVIDELGFRPSHLGTSLAEHRHAANGIVFPDLSWPCYADVVLGFEDAAARSGRSVLIQTTHGRVDPAGAVRDLAGRVDGLVMLGRTVDDAVVAGLVASGVAVTLLARRPVAGADCVTVDNLATARELGIHLAAHGYRSICLLGPLDGPDDVAERWVGLRDALDGVSTELVACDLDEGSGLDAASAILARTDRPDALVCGNDEIALGVIQACEAAGVRVGVDLAVTGWDDIMAARHARPALTTVRQPMRLLGTRGAEVLDERITGTRTTPWNEVLPSELVIRTSCGPHA